MTERDPPATDDDLEDLAADLEALESAVDSPPERRVVRRAVATLGRLSGSRIFGTDDVVQQIVGALLLSAPFVVTEEVWVLAASMDPLQWGITVLMVVAIGYGTLYRADDDRDPDREAQVAGLPLRFVSLLVVSYSSVAILAFVLDAPATFGATTATTAKAVSIGAIFSVVGAATADSLL